jgi:tripartite-type tricarboxylate transporter receptor subunit TctC
LGNATQECERDSVQRGDEHDMKKQVWLTAAVASVLATCLASTASWGQGNYPERSVRLVVPFAPGGVVDFLARSWVDKATPLLGTIVVENVGGAGGTLGAGRVANAKPDGYTLLLGNTSTQIITPMTMAKAPYDPAKAFAPIAILAVSANSIVVNAAMPVKTLKAFVAYAKSNPGKLSYGSAGTGTLTHVAGELFKQSADLLDIRHVPYKGAGPGLNDLLGGHIQMMAANATAQLLNLHKTGKIRILAVASAKRLRGAPDIPTGADEGMPRLLAELFTGLFAPAGTPKSIIDKVAAINTKVMSEQAFQDQLIKSGFEPVTDSNPENAAASIDAERVRLGPVLKSVGLLSK